MVCTANDLSAWKDFPKGLRVLLLDEDSNSAAEMKLKLESMDYIVSAFCNENEAISAILNKPKSFHVAIVEVGTCNSNGSFKFLENAKDLPTIMTSNIHCLSTMMKCIALGAVEFLRKPLSDDKLRNIWQHVVHKAFNAGSSVLSDSLKPVKESVLSMLHLQLENEATTNENPENASPPQANNNEQSEGNDKYPAPSTPQLKQGARLLDDNDCHENTNCSTEKDDIDTETKFVETTFVETTCNNPTTEVILPEEENHRPKETVVKEENNRNDGLKTESSDVCPPRPSDKDSCPKDSNNATIVDNPSKTSGLHTSSGNKANRKKMKVDWTPELHKKFVQAVEKLGVDQAIPSRILELMKVEGLTRHNVASHLQKYRMHRRHILPKEDVDRRWPPHSRDQAMQGGYYPHKPIMAFPPYHPNHAATPASPVYPMWGPPMSNRPPGVRMWGPPPAYPPWQQMEGWHWKPYPGMHADAWGCPVMPPPPPPPPLPPNGSYSSFSQNTSGFHNSGMVNNSLVIPQSSFDFHPTEEVIDKVVKEAISKPWLPLPLGLKPPSAESVLSELSRQGISAVPPRINGSRAC